MVDIFSVRHQEGVLESFKPLRQPQNPAQTFYFARQLSVQRRLNCFYTRISSTKYGIIVTRQMATPQVRSDRAKSS